LGSVATPYQTLERRNIYLLFWCSQISLCSQTSQQWQQQQQQTMARRGSCCWQMAISILLALTVQHTAAGSSQLPSSSEQEATWTATTVTIHKQTTSPVLFQAFQNSSITTIVFATPYFALHSLWDSVAPVVISRNLTVMSSSDPPTVLDMRFLHARIALGKGVEFKFLDINLANDRQATLQCLNAAALPACHAR
jgi:hypothetical protein